MFTEVVAQQPGEVVEIGGETGMVRTECCFIDDDGTFVERLGLAVLAL